MIGGKAVRISHLKRALLAVAVCALPIAQGSAQNAPSASPIDNLKAKNLEVRRNAANQVRLSDKAVQRKALPTLIDLLMNEKDGQVRLAVLDAVTLLGSDAAPAVPALIHMLKTDNAGLLKEELHQDYRSAIALAAIGKPAVEGLRGLLKEKKENVRAEVVMSLGRIGPDAGPAVPDLIPLLGDRSERIRREATLALGRIGKAAIDPLIVASTNPDVIVRSRAVESLGLASSTDDRVHQAVLKCSHDSTPEVRAAAVRSLARFELPADVVLPVLKENLRREEEGVRLAVVNLLNDRRALSQLMAPDLETLLTAKDDGVARHAAYLLRKIGPDAAPLLLKALPDEQSRIDQIAEALGQIGRPVAELLTRSLDAPEPRVRRGAALALGQVRPLATGTVPRLTAGLNDPDVEVKAAFLAAIGYLGPRAGEAVPAVRAMLQKKSAAIRLQVVDILSHAAPRDDRLLGDLMPLIDDPDAKVQRQAIDTIRSLGPIGRKALTPVVAKLDSKDPGVRLAAVELIESHGLAAVDAVPALGLLLADPSPKIRTVSAATLGKLGKAAQPALSRLTPLLADELVEVREAATLALGSLELNAEVVRPHLAKALRDDKTEVRRAATRAIQRLGPQGAIFVPDIILMAAKKENQRSVDRLLRPFERTGPDVRSLPELIKQLDHEQVSVRLLAIKFLGLAGRNARDAIPALERIREDPSAEVRTQAAAACEQIKNPPASGRDKGTTD
jgi:HEAT repeat protein